MELTDGYLHPSFILCSHSKLKTEKTYDQQHFLYFNIRLFEYDQVLSQYNISMKFVVLKLFLFALLTQAAEPKLPLWEYGVGLGYLHFAQYPASNQTTDLLIPFPTFQYRGNILRADDKEGARAYILKGHIWSLEFSGFGLPALRSEDNRARTGMPDLPWMAHMGPQVVGHLSDAFEFKLGLFQALSTDFKLTKTIGQLIDAKFIYTASTQIYDVNSFGFLALELKAASADYLATYFSVESKFANSDRSFFDAQSGFLSVELQYYQAFKIARTTFYLGISHTDYSRSSNQQSPLHKSNQNLSTLAGITYTLGESAE